MSTIRSLNGYEIHDKQSRTQITELESISASMTISTLPYGRSKGDINGDGVIDFDDATIGQDYCLGNVEITDEITLWCMDVDGDGTVDYMDVGTLINEIYERSNEAAHADYYNNWTWDTTELLYYYDISVSDVTTFHSCVVIPKYNNKSSFVKATCMDGVVRVYTLCCPVEEAPCCIVYMAGDGSGVIV